MFCLKNRNCNNTANFIVRNSLFYCRSLSPLGRNFSLISSRYNFNPALIREPNNFSSISSYLSNFCTIQYDKVCTPSFLFLQESILLRNNLLEFDPSYETLSISELDDIITLLSTQWIDVNYVPYVLSLSTSLTIFMLAFVCTFVCHSGVMLWYNWLCVFASLCEINIIHTYRRHTQIST